MKEVVGGKRIDVCIQWRTSLICRDESEQERSSRGVVCPRRLVYERYINNVFNIMSLSIFFVTISHHSGLKTFLIR